MASSPPNLPHHGSEKRPDVGATPEGERMGVLLRILLEDFRMTNIIARVQPGVGGRIPAQCTNPIKFYQTYFVLSKKLGDILMP